MKCLGTVFGALSLGFAGAAAAADTRVAGPTSNDPQLQITMIAEEPQIVTPVGIAVDRRNRLFVVESHTHHRPAEYKGPATDLVKVFLDSNGDGIPDAPQVFAEGFKSAMNLALSPADELYLVHRAGVVLLHDSNGDSKAEKTTTIVALETEQEYPHNGLSGITFSRDGWLYVGLGENFGAPYTLRGTDDRAIHTGPGRGGKVFRCRTDGSGLEEVATGFWNPFGLELDRAGRLFCVDNDPGGRPPCRLLHVVPGGDYGYKRRYDDTNVFNGWDGELPGTLPMLKGTGEAPCGILSADRLALPGGYAGSLLVASWGDAAIEVYRLQPQGASFRATKENLVASEKKFNEAFCPVDLAAAPDGSLYITDWADRTSYPVHGKGRIWRLAARPEVAVERPSHASALADASAGAQRFERLLAADAPARFLELKAALADADPFIRSAAITALAKPVFRDALAKLADDTDPMVRIGGMVARWRSLAGDPLPVLRKAITDPDERLRFLALWWAGEDDIKPLADELGQALAKKPSVSLFQAYLTAAELLAADATAQPPQGKATKPAVPVRQQLLDRILHDDSQPAALQAMAAATVTNLADARTAERLLHFARRGEGSLRREAVRTLGGCAHADVPGTLKAIALDETLTAALRADAISSLARRDVASLPALAKLLDDGDPIVQLETARALRIVANEAPVRSALQKKLQSVRGTSAALAEQIEFALHAGNPSERALARPASPGDWRKAVAEGGDAAAGERVFLHPLTGCTMCHQTEGRGVSIGPDLSNVARSLDRAALIDAILDPSREVAPQYEQHIVTTKAGAVYSGVLVHIGLDGSPLINALGAGRLRVPMAQVARHDTSTLSMMPAGLENTMTVQDFRDLLAYLSALK